MIQPRYDGLILRTEHSYICIYLQSIIHLIDIYLHIYSFIINSARPALLCIVLYCVVLYCIVLCCIVF